MEITKQQKNLIESIKESENCNYTKYVWFHPLQGRFLYNDMYIRYEIVEPLILAKILKYIKIDNHQGEKMLKYGIA